MKGLKIGFWALFFITLVSLCVSFATQNSDLMTLNFFNYTTDASPKWLIVLLAVLVGAVLASLFFIIELIVLESKNIVLRRLNKKMERALKLIDEQNNKKVTPSLSHASTEIFEDSDV